MLVCFVILTFFMLILGERAWAEIIASPAGALGACAIQNPVYYNASTKSDYHYVYMGNNTNKLYRVLYTQANDGPSSDTKNGTPALFLLLEYAESNKRAWDSNKGQAWAASTLRNNYLRTTVYGYFDSTEQGAIMSTTSHESGTALPLSVRNNNDYIYAALNGSSSKTNQLSSDTIFLLSIEEVTNSGYGFNF